MQAVLDCFILSKKGYDYRKFLEKLDNQDLCDTQQ